MLPNILISVIIPIYNVEEYIQECLESVLHQTLAEIEIICVDDASTDTSLKIVCYYAELDKRINVIKNSQNGGLGYSRNRGLEAARGEYIYFLDADDMIQAETLEELYYVAKRYQLMGVYFDKTIYYNEAEPNYDDRFRYRKKYQKIYRGTELFREFVMCEEKWVSACWQLWKLSYLQENSISFYEGILHEDVLFSFLAIIKAKRVCCVNKAYYIYRKRKNSITTSKNYDKKIVGLFVTYCELLKEWNNITCKPETHEAINKYISYWYGRLQRLVYKNNTLPLYKARTPIEEHLFNILVTKEDIGQLINDISEDMFDTINKYNEVILYGAGDVAYEAYAQLIKHDIAIKGIAVSDNFLNASVFMGHKVQNIKEFLNYKESGIIIVATLRKYHSEIGDNLNSLGFKNIIILKNK